MDKVDIDLDNSLHKEELVIRYRGSVLIIKQPYIMLKDFGNVQSGISIGSSRPVDNRLKLDMEIDCSYFYIEKDDKEYMCEDDIDEYFK